MDDKIKQNPKKFVYIFLIATYVFFVDLALHIGAYMYAEHTVFANAFGPSLANVFIRPFAIFPIRAGTLMWTLIMTTIFIVGGAYIYLNEENRKHYAIGKEHGTAQWMSELDRYNKKFTEPFGEVSHDGPNNMILSQEIFAAMKNKETRRNLNVFVIGGSGSGKSYNFVGPNLMQANCSYVVTDPSGGLFKEYGTFFESMGYHVKCFNLSNMSMGNHYNPFNYIAGDKDIEILVTTLISNTTPPDKNGGDPFWEKSETALLVALIAYLYHYCDKKLQNFSNVMKLMRHADIDENDSSSKSDLDKIFDLVESEDPNSFAVKQYKTFKMGAGKTLKGILISCAVRLQAFDLEDVANLTDTDDIDLDSVGDEKTALFVIIPTGEKTFNFLASMMYSQLFQRLYGYCEGPAKFGTVIMDSDEQIVKTFRADSPREKTEEAKAFFERAKNAEISYNKRMKWYELRTSEGELVTWRATGESSSGKNEEENLLLRGKAKQRIEAALEKIRNGRIVETNEMSNHGERLPIHTRLMLDEFANIGKIPEFPEKVATIRKYEISVAIILQSLSQMKKMYKDEWEELSGNCDSTIYLGGGADQMTTEWISKLLGKETRFIQTASFSKEGSVSINKQGVELFAPDQLRTMDEDDCVVLLKSQFAYKGKKYMSHLHPNRKMVQDLERSTGGYVFNPVKSEVLLNELSGANLEKTHAEKYGTPKKKTDEELEEDKKIDEQKKQQKKEYISNSRQNGEMIIGENVNVRDGNSEVAQKFGMADKDRIDESLEALISSTDDEWEIDEIVFGAQQMS